MFTRVFEDKRLTSAVMCTWLAVVMYAYGLSDSGDVQNAFMNVGPSPQLVIMGIHVDSWNKWFMVTLFAFCNTAMNEFFSNSIDPWIINTLQDEKTTEIPYSKFTCILISQLWNVYCHCMSLVGISLLLAQVDLLVVRIVADVLVSTFAMTRFLTDKTVQAQYGVMPEDTEMAPRPHSRPFEPIKRPQPVDTGADT